MTEERILELTQYPDLAACLTASAERPAGALNDPCRAGGTYFLAEDAVS